MHRTHVDDEWQVTQILHLLGRRRHADGIEPPGPLTNFGSRRLHYAQVAVIQRQVELLAPDHLWCGGPVYAPTLFIDLVSEKDPHRVGRAGGRHGA